MHGSLFSEAEQPGGASGWYTAYCDGGSRGNPGPAGYGAVVLDPSGAVAGRLSEFLGRQTNNYAEYQGLLAVLEWAVQHGVEKLILYSDSELMVNQMKGRYKVASPALRPLWEEARRRAQKLVQLDLRHTLRGGNTEADKLANDAMDRGMGKRPSAPDAVREKAPGQRAQPADSPARAAAQPSKSQERLEGYVKNGVVHLLEGQLPEGTFVTVLRKA